MRVFMRVGGSPQDADALGSGGHLIVPLSVRGKQVAKGLSAVCDFPFVSLFSLRKQNIKVETVTDTI